MKTIYSLGLGSLAALAASLPLCAQVPTAEVNFETNDYKALGVYDTWEHSPFRTGQLEGNVGVVGNHLADPATNPSGKMLGFQRSRYGSNTYGARVDLKEPMLIEEGKPYYAHVMINKPVDGRVMLIGLGKRSDWEGQRSDVEQFWVYPVNEVKTGEWADGVFQIKCNPGVEIYSLVLVPHCENPLTLPSDFIAYFDEIEINGDCSPRFGRGDYPLNFVRTERWSRPDRAIKGIGLNSPSSGEQRLEIPRRQLRAYNELFAEPLHAKAGETVTPIIDYDGTWMNGYVYLDRGNDGDYSYGVDSDNRLDASTDLMAFSAYAPNEGVGARNSAGESLSDPNVLAPPAFTIPADLKPGIYRLRYKVDWNSIDPAGNNAGNNNILANGGGVVEALLNVHGDKCLITNDNRNGEVVTADGRTLNQLVVPFGEDLKIKMVPSNGFAYNGIRVRHGYNLTGDSLVKSTPQFFDVIVPASDFNLDNTYTIPGRLLDGDILIEGLFVEKGTETSRPVRKE